MEFLNLLNNHGPLLEDNQNLAIVFEFQTLIRSLVLEICYY